MRGDLIRAVGYNPILTKLLPKGREMNRRGLWLALLMVVSLQLCLAQEASKTHSPAQLQCQLSRLRQGFPGNMAIYMKNLANGDEIALDADTIYETFSVVKLAIAAEVLRQSEAGKFSLADRVALKAGDRRLPSGVLYALDPGLQPTVKDLLTLMIIISDNEATDLLADKVGRGNITQYMRSLGLEKISIEFSDLDWDRTWLGTLDPVYKTASGDQTVEFPFGKHGDAQVTEAFRHTIYDAGIYFGHSSARDIGRLLELMVEGKLVSKQASNQLLDTMEMQQVNDRFPRYLRDVRVAHKTGDGQPFIANDAGILWVGKQPIVLVVFTGHHRGETAALHDTIARVAALVVKHYGGQLQPDFAPPPRCPAVSSPVR
jgi:beta-lactamase class A